MPGENGWHKQTFFFFDAILFFLHAWAVSEFNQFVDRFGASQFLLRLSVMVFLFSRVLRWSVCFYRCFWSCLFVCVHAFVVFLSSLGLVFFRNSADLSEYHWANADYLPRRKTT